MTVHCPLDCLYLQDARRHEKISGADPDQFPNKEIRVSPEFLREHEPVVLAIAVGVLEAALDTGAVDYDVREALEALIRTYQTLESGLVYETRPPNTLAAGVYRWVQESITRFREEETKRRGATTVRDGDILRTLAFLQRLELDRNNGRKLGRAYIDFLRSYFPKQQERPVIRGADSHLIIP